MGCIGNCLVVMVNLSVMLLGLAIVGLSSYILHLSLTYQHMVDEGSEILLYVPCATLIGGVLLTLVCFFGCCGVLRRSPCMLRAYGSMVLFLFSLELACGVFFVVKKEDFLQLVRQGMKKNIQEYGPKNKQLSDGIDITQHDLKCCGVDGYQDWAGITEGHTSVTKGCCKHGPGIDPETCYRGVLLLPPSEINRTIFTRGCFGALQAVVTHESVALGAMAIALSVMQLLLMVIAFTQATRFSRHKEHYGYNYDGVVYHQ